MNKLPCPFRYDERQTHDGQVATCGLLAQLLQVDDSELCSVPRAACEICCQTVPVASRFVNSVFPSLLLQASTQYLERRDRTNDEILNAKRLIRNSELAIASELASELPRIDTCDVFAICHDASALTRKSIASILAQNDVIVTLHLVLADRGALPLNNEFASLWNVQVYEASPTKQPYHIIHETIPKIRSEYIAFHDSRSTSFPDRLCSATRELYRTGADFLGSPMVTDAGVVEAFLPTIDYGPTIPCPTLVFRRNAFLDLGGFADRTDDYIPELLYRAHLSGKRVHIIPFATVQLAGEWQPPRIGAKPEYTSRFQSLRHHAMGYPQQSISADVVIPIHGQLEYAKQAIESIVNQVGAEAVVHLVDDASPECTQDLFRFWGSHPRVRRYRNTTNIGQYASFNNVSRYFETELAVVQDADDISLPHRLYAGGNLLGLCDAEYYAASVDLFGDETLMSRAFPNQQFRLSSNASPNSAYFALNPTACFRVSMFRRLGGYSDYGGVKYRGGLDSEFMIRAHHSGVPFVISSEVVTKFRVHGNSATRCEDTGFGSQARERSRQECQRRFNLFRHYRFHPSAFGTIRRYESITERL